jgi:hypothetical protein
MNHPIKNSNYREAKNYRKRWVAIKAESRNAIFIVLGIFSAAFGFKGFLLPSHFSENVTQILIILTSFSLSFPPLIFTKFNIKQVCIGKIKFCSF